jgi:hypothetical protein
MKDVMIVGYDTWHDTSKKDVSVGAVVCSFNTAMTRYLSYAMLHKNSEELCTQLKTNLTIAVRRYQVENGVFPKRIIYYRDGVGAGQIKQLLEVKSFFTKF